MWRALASTFSVLLVLSLSSTTAATSSLAEPPKSWADVCRGMAAENAPAWADLDEVLRAARGFIDPMLEGRADANWSPSALAWIP